MHYIRFLQTPKVHVDKDRIQLRAVVTLTTDLGETFYPHDVDLIATLRDSATDGEIYLRRKLTWPASARSLPISIDLGRQDIEWPACMHVAVRNSGNNNNNHHHFLPPIVDIWSGTLNPLRGQFSSGHRVERRFTSLAERTLSLLEDAGDSIARHLWDGSQALAQHLDATLSLADTSSPLPLLEYVLVSATYRRIHVLELGCGVGSVGISLAQTIPDVDVLLTDLPEAAELVEENVARMNPAISSRVAFSPLDWTLPLTPQLAHTTHGTKSLDLIIVSECTYNTDTLPPLVSTLSALLARSPKAVIVLATKTRHESEAVFLDLMRDAGIIEEGRTRLALPGLPGDGYGDRATDVGVHVFHGREHRLSLSPRGGSEEHIGGGERRAGGKRIRRSESPRENGGKK